MVNTSTNFMVVWILFCVAAATASRSIQYHATDGICKSTVEPRGYICHEHTVTTKYGYILSLQRIPSSRSGKPANKPPVLLQHGILSDGATWLSNPPDQSLGFILADNGFDVWIANSRGTTYSRGHVSLSPNDPAYWEWSWDELAAYDIPAFVQFVYDQTQKNKLHYVGHSLGTLIALAAFSQGKVLNMIRSAALLSPIAHLGLIQSSPARFTADTYLAEDLYRLGFHEFELKGGAATKLLEEICKNPAINCFDLLDSFTGENCCINSSEAVSYLERKPQPTSIKNMVHLAQMIRSGTIAMYDYDNADDNMNHYHQPSPPTYNMQNISNNLPLFLGYGGKDYLSDVKDVKLLLNDLTNHDRDSLTVQLIEDYAHLDFVMAVNANRLVYDPIMAFFKLH